MPSRIKPLTSFLSYMEYLFLLKIM